MPAITPIQREHQKAIIRRYLVFNPNISVRGLQKTLDEAPTPLHLDLNYLGQLVAEIRQDRIREVTEQTKIDVYAQMSDTVEYVNNQLRAIANEEKLVYMSESDGKPTHSPEARIFAQNNRIKALVEVVKNTERLFNLKMDLGIIERSLGRADVRILELLSFIDNERNVPANSGTDVNGGLQAPDGISVGDQA